MAGVIPFEPGDPEQTIEIALDGETYLLRARWNTRVALWFLDIYERDAAPIALGLALVLGVLIGARSSHPLLRGGLMMVDESQTGREAGLYDLGRRVKLFYLTPGELMLARSPALPVRP